MQSRRQRRGSGGGGFLPPRPNITDDVEGDAKGSAPQKESKAMAFVEPVLESRMAPCEEKSAEVRMMNLKSEQSDAIQRKIVKLQSPTESAGLRLWFLMPEEFVVCASDAQMNNVAGGAVSLAVRVTEVIAGKAAEAKGVQAGDFLFSINGCVVHSREEVIQRMQPKEEEAEYPLTLEFLCGRDVQRRIVINQNASPETVADKTVNDSASNVLITASPQLPETTMANDETQAECTLPSGNSTRSVSITEGVEHSQLNNDSVGLPETIPATTNGKRKRCGPRSLSFGSCTKNAPLEPPTITADPNVTRSPVTTQLLDTLPAVQESAQAFEVERIPLGKRSKRTSASQSAGRSRKRVACKPSDDDVPLPDCNKQLRLDGTNQRLCAENVLGVGLNSAITLGKSYDEELIIQDSNDQPVDANASPIVPSPHSSALLNNNERAYPSAVLSTSSEGVTLQESKAFIIPSLDSNTGRHCLSSTIPDSLTTDNGECNIAQGLKVQTSDGLAENIGQCRGTVLTPVQVLALEGMSSSQAPTETSTVDGKGLPSLSPSGSLEKDSLASTYLVAVPPMTASLSLPDVIEEAVTSNGNPMPEAVILGQTSLYQPTLPGVAATDVNGMENQEEDLPSPAPSMYTMRVIRSNNEFRSVVGALGPPSAADAIHTDYTAWLRSSSPFRLAYLQRSLDIQTDIIAAIGFLILDTPHLDALLTLPCGSGSIRRRWLLVQDFIIRGDLDFTEKEQAADIMFAWMRNGEYLADDEREQVEIIVTCSFEASDAQRFFLTRGMTFSGFVLRM